MTTETEQTVKDAIAQAFMRLNSDHPVTILWFCDLYEHIDRMEILAQMYQWDNEDGGDETELVNATFTIPDEDDNEWDYFVGYDDRRSCAMIAMQEEDGDFDNHHWPNDRFHAEKAAYYRDWWIVRNNRWGETVQPPPPEKLPHGYASEIELPELPEKGDKAYPRP